MKINYFENLLDDELGEEEYAVMKDIENEEIEHEIGYIVKRSGIQLSEYY